MCIYIYKVLVTLKCLPLLLHARDDNVEEQTLAIYCTWSGDH